MPVARAGCATQVQCCGFSVEYIHYNWNGRDEKQWRFNLELANIGSIGNFLGAGTRQRGWRLPVRLLVTGRRRLRRAATCWSSCAARQPETRVFGVVSAARQLAAAAARARASLEADLDDPRGGERCVDEARPDAIVHLAGQSSVHQSWLDPGRHAAHQRARRRAPAGRGCGAAASRPRVLVVGSAEEYGVGARRRAAAPGGRRRCGRPRPTR